MLVKRHHDLQQQHFHPLNVNHIKLGSAAVTKHPCPQGDLMIDHLHEHLNEHMS